MGKSKQELQRAGHIISSGTDECMYAPLFVYLGQSWFLHSYIVQGSLPHCLRNGATYSGLGLLISINIHVLPYISTGHPDLDNPSTEAFFFSDSRLWKVGIPKPTSIPHLSKPHGLRGTPVATQTQTRCVPQWPNQVRKETFLWGGVTPVGFHVPASGKGECSRLVLWSLRQLCACYGLNVKHPSLASVLLNTHVVPSWWYCLEGCGTFQKWSFASRSESLGGMSWGLKTLPCFQTVICFLAIAASQPAAPRVCRHAFPDITDCIHP